MRRTILAVLVLVPLGCGASNAGGGTGGPGGAGGGGGDGGLGGTGGTGGDEPVGPLLACTPEGDDACGMDLGLSVVGTPAAAELVLCNRGDAAAWLEGTEVRGPFAAEGLVEEIPPRSCLDAARVTFTPDRGGLAVGALAVRYQGGTLDIPLAGQGDASVFDCDFDAPVAWVLPSGAWVNIRFPCFNQSDLDGTVILRFSGVDAEVFGTDDRQFPIEGGRLGDVVFEFAVEVPGALVADLELWSEFGGREERFAVVPIHIDAIDRPVQCLEALDFGDVRVGTTLGGVVTCDNVTDFPIGVRANLAPGSAASFTEALPELVTIPARSGPAAPGRIELDVVFAPDEPGPVTGTLEVAHEFGATIEVQLRGAGSRY